MAQVVTMVEVVAWVVWDARSNRYVIGIVVAQHGIFEERV